MPLPKHVSYSSLSQHRSKVCCLHNSFSKSLNILFEASLLSQSMFLWQVLFEVDENPLRSILPLPMYVSYWALIPNLGKSVRKHPSSSKECFLFNSYWKSILIALAQLRDAGRSIGASYHCFHIVFTQYELAWKRQGPENSNDTHFYNLI